MAFRSTPSIASIFLVLFLCLVIQTSSVEASFHQLFNFIGRALGWSRPSYRRSYNNYYQRTYGQTYTKYYPTTYWRSNTYSQQPTYWRSNTYSQQPTYGQTYTRYPSTTYRKTYTRYPSTTYRRYTGFQPSTTTFGTVHNTGSSGWSHGGTSTWTNTVNQHGVRTCGLRCSGFNNGAPHVSYPYRGCSGFCYRTGYTSCGSPCGH